MATLLAFKWNGAYPSTSVIFRFSSADPSTYDVGTLPWTVNWAGISTNGNGVWAVAGSTEGIAYSTDDGFTWTGLDYASTFNFTLPAKPDTGVGDGRSAVTISPISDSLFYDGSKFVLYGYSINAPGYVAWTSTNGSTWTVNDLGAIAYHNNTHTGFTWIPNYKTHDKDRQGRYLFEFGQFSNYPTPHTHYSLGVEPDSLGPWDDVGFQTGLQSIDGIQAPVYVFDPFDGDEGEGPPHRYGFEYVGGFGYPVNFKKNKMKTDGTNMLMLSPRRYYQRSVYSFNIAHWDTTPVLNPDSGYMEKPWPEIQGTLGFTTGNNFLPQEVIFTGDFWMVVGGMLDPSTGGISKWGYGISTDGGITWDLTEDGSYESDIGRCNYPECWDLQFDGRHVWYFGRERGVGTILDPINVWGVYDTQAATPFWQFYGEGSSLGFGESECAFNVLNSFIYTSLDPVISITCEDITTKMGRVLRTSTVLNLGDINSLEFRNVRGSGAITLTGVSDIYKFNAISLSTSNIKIAQKNLLLTETDIVKVKGMPLGIGGRFAQLNHYVRNIYNDNPIVYMPLNDRDEDISGTPQNSQTDNLQEEVF